MGNGAGRPLQARQCLFSIISTSPERLGCLTLVTRQLVNDDGWLSADG